MPDGGDPRPPGPHPGDDQRGGAEGPDDEPGGAPALGEQRADDDGEGAQHPARLRGRQIPPARATGRPHLPVRRAGRRQVGADSWAARAGGSADAASQASPRPHSSGPPQSNVPSPIRSRAVSSVAAAAPNVATCCSTAGRRHHSTAATASAAPAATSAAVPGRDADQAVGRHPAVPATATTAAAHRNPPSRPGAPSRPARAAPPTRHATATAASSSTRGHGPELVPQLGPEEQRRDHGQRAPDVAEDLGEHRPAGRGRRPGVEGGDGRGLVRAEDAGRDGPVEQVAQRRCRVRHGRPPRSDGRNGAPYRSPRDRFGGRSA